MSSYLFQFRFASTLDIILLVVGVLASIGNGSVGPLMMYFYAAVIENFSGRSHNLCKFNLTDLSAQHCEPGILLTPTNYYEKSR